MIHLTRAERLMLSLIARQHVPTWLLTGYLREEHIATFNHLHHMNMVEPVTAECHAYQISALGRSVLTASHPSSMFDQVYREED